MSAMSAGTPGLRVMNGSYLLFAIDKRRRHTVMHGDVLGEKEAGRSKVTTMFELRIRNQHWLGEPHEQVHDGCSHGQFKGGKAMTVAFGEACSFNCAFDQEEATIRLSR
jgi:hypothetical protein